MTMKPPSDNAFERDMPGTAARTLAESAIEKLRQRGGVFVDAVRATRMPMALTDPTLPGNPIVFANQSFLNLSGYNMEEVLGQQPHFMNGPDTDRRDAGLFRDILDSGQDGVVETVQYRKDGRRFVATVLLSAFKDDAGNTLHHFLSWADVTRRVEAEDDAADLRKAQDALRESEARLRKVINAETVGIVFFDLVGGISDANDAFLRMIGFTRDELEAGKVRYDELTPPEWQWRDEQTIAELREKGESGPYEKEYFRKDGSKMWILCSSSLVDGHMAVEFVVDVTERKRGEERQQTLLAELQHRGRNTLAVIRSIVRRTAASSDSVEDFERHLDGRLGALARAQAYVTGDAEGGMDLELLIRDELLAHASDGSQYASIEGPAVRLSAKQAETLGLAIHELTTNAVKYGALASDGNKVEVRWSVEGEGNHRELRFNWLEDLAGRGLEKPTRTGFGSELLDRVMQYELDARPEIAFTLTGFEYRVAIPLAPVAANH